MFKSKQCLYIFTGTLTGAEGGNACVSSYIICNDIFQKIMNVAGNVNVRKRNIMHN